jgi:hypothetical protein
MSEHTDDFEPLFLVPIEPGEYPLRYLCHEFFPEGFKGAAKLVMEFEIAYGRHAGRKVKRFYNVDVITTKENGKTRKRWKAIRNGDLLIEFVDIFGDRLDGEKGLQLHSIPLARYYGAFTVIGYLEYAKQNAKKRKVDPRTVEPIVRDLLRIDEGEGGSSSSPLLNSSFLSSSTPPLVESASKPIAAKGSEQADYRNNIENPPEEVQKANVDALKTWLSEDEMML